MSNKPLVSVIVIFLNEERFIREAIESVFAQTYDNWELLLVDDGSTDRSCEIALECAERFPGKVCYLEHDSHQNCGMSASRNRGISYAKGEYIAFLDADDVWLPNILEEQVEILESHPEAAMVYGPIQWWYSWTERNEDLKKDYIREPRVQTNTPVKPPTLFTVFLQNEAQVPSGILVRRIIVERVGGFEETFRGMYEDQVFCAKVCLESPVFVSSKCWYKYRNHQNSACSTAVRIGQYDSSRVLFLTWVEEYLSKRGIKDSTAWKALQNELYPYRHPVLYHFFLKHFRYLVKQLKRVFKPIARRAALALIRN
ncbi:MAG TPA: glycosyltransferase family A protein [Thermodesulfobacteriota bacterium]|nr:glycosyltransferase family A protein [Thermodesulfobacteriota bacterium]